MDPFSISVGGLTVIGALIKIAQEAKNIVEGLTEAPKELRSLAEEADQLRAVLADVVEASQLNVGAAGSISVATTLV